MGDASENGGKNFESTNSRCVDGVGVAYCNIGRGVEILKGEWGYWGDMLVMYCDDATGGMVR